METSKLRLSFIQLQVNSFKDHIQLQEANIKVSEVPSCSNGFSLILFEPNSCSSPTGVEKEVFLFLFLFLYDG
ncbi:hypothetical protein PRUPE_1G189600 [Prunus persica]|uniref:Uncharacterized protein n=1 Tax=Prunus persica TaxID=3760 RepID=A0A251QZJ1_PRUPE|nr:hypothetical protein PRUPE_1G189600 [Prunus persica]